MTKYHAHRRGPLRENVEAIATAVVLALVIRHFCFEAFQIPTGSMAPTLKGIHRTMVCPNCTRRFSSDISKDNLVLCPNCRYRFSRQEVLASPCRDFPSWLLGAIPRAINVAARSLNRNVPPYSGGGGGNRILVNKFLFDYREPQRWDVVVFKFPEVLASCRDRMCRQRMGTVPRRVTPSQCPMCGGRNLTVGKAPTSLFPVDLSRCSDCGWQEETRPRRCPTCGGPLRTQHEKNYIKRLIALPGETVRIRHGNIYIDGKIARKTPEAQDAMWRFVYDSGLPNKLPNRSFSEFWQAENGRIERRDEGFALHPDTDDMAWAEFRAPIGDFVPYSGYTGGDLPVPDIKTELELALPRVSSTVCVRIVENDPTAFSTEGTDAERYRQTYDLRLVTRVSGSGTPDRWIRLYADDRQVGNEVKLEPADRLKLAFWNADDAIAVTVNGKLAAEALFDRDPDDVLSDRIGARFLVGVEGTELDVRRLRLWRDTYYRHDAHGAAFGFASAEVAVSNHGYFMMGDNSRNSSDSRMWGEVPADFLIGKAFVVWYPFDNIREVR